MSEPTALSLDELIAGARLAGVRLSGTRLHNWRKSGLMLTPDLRPRRSGGRGKESFYPASALPQAVAISDLLKQSRDNDAVRWQLFLTGFPISLPHLRTQLEAEVTRLLRQREELIAAADTGQSSDKVAE